MVSKALLQLLNYLFDDKILQNISAVSKLIEFQKYDIIIDIGQDLHFIPLLIMGNITVFREDSHGGELLLNILESGDTCAMSLTCYISKFTSKIRAIASTNFKVIMIPTAQMRQWFNSHESWRTFIFQSYQIRFEEMLEIIDMPAFMKMD